jgi:hypothetical protein
MFMVYRQRLSISLFLLVLSLALFLTSCGAQTTKAVDMQVSDDANVLNINRVKTEANGLSRSIFIFTTANFPLDPAPDWMKDEATKADYQKMMLASQFDTQTRDYMNEHGMDIAIGIDVKDRYVSIQSKDDVPLSNTEAKNAVSAFKTNFANNDYNTALLAMLKNVKDTIAKNESEHAWDGLWTTLKWIGVVAALILISVMSKIFGWNSSSSNRGYHHHHSSYHSSSSSSSSSSSDSGSSGGGAGGFF